MNPRTALIFLCLSLSLFDCGAEVELITEPKPGQEYVFVQTSASGAKPIVRKDIKLHEPLSENQPKPFETSHKLPASLTYLYHAEEDQHELPEKKSVLHKPPGPQKKAINKREAVKLAPAPEGAIKLDPQKLIQKYKTVLKTASSTIKAPSMTKRRGRKNSSDTVKPTITTNSRKRSKKELNQDTGKVEPQGLANFVEATSPKPVVATTETTILASSSDKQRSRIQIKKGPNGQEYEYEYVYYYYDDDDNVNAGKDAKKTATNEVIPPVNTISSTTTSTPSGRNKNRGRQMPIGDEDVVGEERLPTNTRFPPRSRNLESSPTTTSHPEPTRGRGRSTTTTVPEQSSPATDSASDESSQGGGSNRSRNRANVRRPSLDLVDSVSFNTHSSGPSFPTDLPAGPVRFLGATPNERADLTLQLPLETRDNTATPEAPTNLNNPPSLASVDATTAVVLDNDVNTVQEQISPMDKVALDLYAILQNTQRLNGEDASAIIDGQLGESIDSIDAETSTGLENIESITNLDISTSIEEAKIFSSSTTTTTTTTTPPPEPTVNEPAFGRGRYRSRGSIGGVGGRKPIAVVHSGSTEAPSDTTTKARNKFGGGPIGGNGATRPSFGGRSRLGTRTTQSAPIEGESDVKEESKSTIGRSRFSSSSGSRTRVRTTPSDSATASSDSSSTPATFSNSRPSLRPRPTFNLRSRTRPTQTSTAVTEEVEHHQPQELSTPRPRTRVTVGAGVRPLRPGPRINIGGRGRLGTTTESAVVLNAGDEGVQQAAASSPIAANENGYNEAKTDNSNGVPADGSATVPANGSPLNRLRNRQRIVPKAKTPALSTAAPPRRINPLLSRRLTKPGTTEAVAAAAGAESAVKTDHQEASSGTATFDGSEPAAEQGDGESAGIVADTTTTTTEEPRGLSKLLGRRKLAQRTPGTIA